MTVRKNFSKGKKDLDKKKLYKIITQMRIMTSKTTIRVLTSQFRLDIVWFFHAIFPYSLSALS